MPRGEPFIPEMITVHLGKPSNDGNVVTIPFPDYVKNVASSEIYPTWPESSLRANIYVIMTFALNRIYTEWYRSRGYDFDITDSTQYDQKFINGREVFENISQLVDEQINSYIRRQGTTEPLFAAFCNGTTVTCDGLSQWGTVDLANQGYDAYDILRYYYGDD
ncbi:MAG: SpoIID/LytB domain-containing protein, partial [Ruminococcus sp.]